jgi:hypothetical protein
MNERKLFLIEMYKQMFNDVDRHLKIVWQVVGVLVGAFAVLALVEKHVLSIDMASGLIILLAIWVIVHVYDSNYWYNRNLVIIANIERQFLDKADLVNIQYYFGKHRDKNAVQTSLKIQLYFCLVVIVLFLVYQFSKSIYPGFDSVLSIENVRIEKVIPYVTLLIGYFIVRWIKNKRIRDYDDFLRKSPGIDIDTSGIDYSGSSHPVTP